jgi:hypothetical protein
MRTYLSKLAPIIMLFAALLTGGCETTDGQLVQQGHDQHYIDGFHDGRHSGISEAGNPFDHYIRDEERFASDTGYHRGWLDGEAEGKRLQAQADTAGSVMSGAYTAGKVSDEVDKQNDPERAANKALKNTDTSALKNLGK